MRKVSKKQKERNKTKKESKDKLFKLFLEIWDERADERGGVYCFETGTYLQAFLYRGLSSTYDHVLEKGKDSYPQYTYTKRNIIIIHPEVHQQKGRDLDKVPKIKAYREYLLSLHAENKLNDDDDDNGRSFKDEILE